MTKAARSYAAKARWAPQQSDSNPNQVIRLGFNQDLWHDPLNYFVRLSRQSGDVIRMKLGTQEILFVNHPDPIRRIFRDNKENYIKSKYYRKLMPLLGQGLFTTEGELWRQQRTTTQASFRGRELRKMLGQMAAATIDMLSQWEQFADDEQEFDVSREATRLTLDVVLRTLFDVSLSEQDVCGFDKALTALLLEAEKRIWSLNVLRPYMPTRSATQFRAALKTLDSIVYRLIDQRMANMRGSRSLFDRLCVAARVRGWNRASRKMLRDEVLSLIVAGHETTANALAWTWHHLATAPDHDRTVYTEAQRVIGDSEITFESLQQLDVTRRVFQESLRFYPPVWTFSRQALVDDTLGSVRVKSGDVVMICAYAMHRRGQFWEDPEVFDPARFKEAAIAKRNPFVYFPFGGGRRTCLGNRFAMMEAQVVLALVARRFRLQLVPGQNVLPQAMVTIRPRDGIRVRLERRPSHSRTRKPAQIAA